MKTHPTYILICLFLFSLFVSCSSDEQIQPIGKGRKLAVLGEAKANESVSVQLFYIENEKQNTNKIPLSTDAKVFVISSNDSIELERSNDFVWTSENEKINDNREYHLQVLEDNKLRKIATFVPPTFVLKVEKQEKPQTNEQNLSITISDESTKSRYTLSCFTNDTTSTKPQHLFLTSNSTVTDNYIFNELDTPCKTIFLHKKQKSTHLNIVLPNESCKLLIKRVDTNYYNYLYNLELQSINTHLVGIQSKQNEYIGYWGGVFLKEVSIE